MLALPAAPCLADCPESGPDAPRTLILALDGVPFAAVQRAREQGAFAAWSEPVPLISTFPSLTNVAFTALFQPFDVGAANGYEIRYFDLERNGFVGGTPFGYEGRVFAWRDVFDVTGTTLGGKLSNYTRPVKRVWHEIEQAEQVLLASSQELILAHVGGTDALLHLRGYGPIVEFLAGLDDRLVELKRSHLEQRGRPLRVVLLSDHGNSERKVRFAKWIRRRLGRAGLEVTDRLEQDNDVVTATFGLVNYGALHLAADRAETAALAVVKHKAVELAAWASADGAASVVGKRGRGEIAWRRTPTARHFSYSVEGDDPLRLRGAVGRMEQSGLFDADGFAAEADWLRESAYEYFPDPLRRLADGLTAPYVTNRATVLFSLKPGYAWGWKSGFASSWLKGGRLEGTHGGLDRASSLGVLMSDDPALAAAAPVHVDDAMARFAELGRCVMAERTEPSVVQTRPGS